jgi:CheY-like chemotaxis protein
MQHNSKIEILIVDDDAEDRRFIIDALDDIEIGHTIREVDNGEDMLQYLRNEGKYFDKEKYPKPGMILLDLNMPRKKGCEALKEIKADPDLYTIPIIVLTTSKTKEGVQATYLDGVFSYLTKPVTVAEMGHIMKSIKSLMTKIEELNNSDISKAATGR